MKRIFIISLLAVSFQVYCCSIQESESCQMTYTLDPNPRNINIETRQRPATGGEPVVTSAAVSALVVRSEISGYEVGRGSRTDFSVVDDDGLVTLTAVFNVLSSNGLFQQNLNQDVVLDSRSFEYLKAAASQLVTYIAAHPEQNLLESEARQLKEALESVNSNIPRIKKGLLRDKLSPILLKINQEREDSDEMYSAMYPLLNPGEDTSSGSSQRLCVNPRSGLRCGPGFIVSSLGANFCTRKFDTGEVFPTSNCPQGVAYSYSSSPQRPSNDQHSGGTRQ
jgi:hypothetical protein